MSTSTHDLRGILVMDERLPTVYAATSQAGPRPGVAVPSDTYDVAIDTSGTLDGAQADVTFSIERAGGVGVMTSTWKYSGETARSFDPPLQASEFEFIGYGATANHLHAVRIPDTGLVVMCGTDSTSTVVSYSQAETGKWTSATVSATGNATRACLCVLPSGRLICLYTYQITASLLQIFMSFSDDAGVTWTVGSRGCLETPLALTPSYVYRLRAAELNGQIAVVAWVNDGALDYLYQWVSLDNGARLEPMATNPATSADIACPDLVSSRGALYLATVQRLVVAGSDYTPWLRTLSSASSPLTTATAVAIQTAGETPEWGTFAAGRFLLAEMALCVDDDGRMYAIGRDHAGTYETMARLSTDGGATWVWANIGAGHPTGSLIYRSAVATTYLQGMCAVAERGRVVLPHVATVNSVYDGKLACLYLGGWSSSAMPDSASYADGAGVAGWNLLWLPWFKPEAYGGLFTEDVLTGAPTRVLGSTGVTVTSGVAEAQSWKAAVSLGGSTSAGILCTSQVKVTAGTASIHVRISDGVNGYAIRVEVTTTTIHVYDINGAVYWGSAVSTTAAQDGVVIMVALAHSGGNWALNDGQISVFWRAAGNSALVGPKADRLWTQYDSAYAGLSSAALATSYVRWVVDASTTAVWRWWGISSGQYVFGNIAVTATTRGRIIPDGLSPIHIAEGLRVSASAGPGYHGQQFTIPTAYDYPVSAIDPANVASPWRGWRSTGLGQQDVTLTVDRGYATTDLIGVYLGGINWRTATLYADSGAANKVCDIDAAIATGLGYARALDMIRPNASGTGSTAHLQEMALYGATFRTATSARKVAGNTAGGWLTSSVLAYRPVRLYLDGGTHGGDAASGTDGELWSPSILLITTYGALQTMMLRIPAQDCADTYFSIGVMATGRVHILGHQWSWGRSMDWSPSYDLVETRGGQRRGRKRARTREAIEIAWDDPVQHDTLYTSGTGAGYIGLGSYGSPPPIAAPADTLLTLGGLLERTGGAATPVVLIPAITQPASTPTTTPISVKYPDRAVYGRIMSEKFRSDGVSGDEFNDTHPESFRGGRLRFEREL